MITTTQSSPLQRSLSLPNLHHTATGKKSYPRSLEQFSSHVLSLYQLLIHKVKQIESDFTALELEKILRFAKEQFDRIGSDILYQIPKGFDGLNRSIFLNGKKKMVYLPLKREIVGSGQQNNVKKCVLIQLGNNPSVRLIVKISRRLGFLESEKCEISDWEIRKELKTAIALNEMRTLRRLASKNNVLPLIDGCLYQGTCKKEPVDKMVLFTEFFKSNLYQACNENRLGNLSESEKIEIIYKIAKGLAATHEEKIVHKDLKLENVLISRLDNLSVVLTDYGHSCPIGMEHHGLCGRGSYFAWPPEVLENIVNQGLLSLPSHYGVDLWAFGILIHELFLGEVEWVSLIDKIKKRFLLIYRREQELDPSDPFIQSKRNLINEEKMLMMHDFIKFKEMVHKLEKEKIEETNIMMWMMQRLLRFDSNKRISAKEVVQVLENVCSK